MKYFSSLFFPHSGEIVGPYNKLKNSPFLQQKRVVCSLSFSGEHTCLCEMGLEDLGDILKKKNKTSQLLRLLVIRARSQGSGCTAAIRLVVHPVF
jgi:hypothetical protein